MFANVLKHRSLFYTSLINSHVRAIVFVTKRSVYAKAGLKSFPHGKNPFCILSSRTAIPSLLQVRVHSMVGGGASPAVTFDEERVQELLQKMTGRDYDKIFAVRVEELEVPKYQLMSDDQLQEVYIPYMTLQLLIVWYRCAKMNVSILHAFSQARREMDEMADLLLKMPPQPPQREERGQFISKDEQLEEFDECRYVFTDVAVGNNNEVCVLLGYFANISFCALVS